MNNFDKWFAEQLASGLVDIKFAIVPGKGISREAVQDEILSAEAAISANLFRSAPMATSMNRPEVQEILNSAAIA